MEAMTWSSRDVRVDSSVGMRCLGLQGCCGRVLCERGVVCVSGVVCW